jgi:chemotaxis protein CheD
MYRAGIGFKGRELVIIHPGEYYSAKDELVISTVLGSCISVALYDPSGKGGGLNHFMLPGAMRSSLVADQNAKYGMYAMDLLVNDLMKLGVERRALVAKVFGGAAVLQQCSAVSKVPESNVRFAFEYLADEGIRIVSSDVGGTEPRKIYFYPDSGRVLLKRIRPQSALAVTKEESEYLERVRKRGEGDVVLF